MKLLSFVFIILVSLSSCAERPIDPVSKGVGVGSAVGAAAGAILDKENRWRGGVIGGALGAIFGGAMSDIAVRASTEAARENRTVVYESNDGFRRVEATPETVKNNCTIVREKTYSDGELVSDTTREVCS